MNNWISKDAIVHIGLCRVKNICAWCNKRMDIERYNIQLCKKCREEHLNRILKDENKGDGNNLMRYALAKNDAFCEDNEK